MDNLYVKTLFDSLHVLATVVWIGGMFVNFIILRPAMVAALDPPSTARLMQAVMKRFRIAVYISVVVLGVTGIPLKIINENYVSIFHFENPWAIVSFVKHLVYGILTLLAIVNFEVMLPGMSKTASSGDREKLAKLQRRMGSLGLLAMLSAIIILILSSLMRFL